MHSNAVFYFQMHVPLFVLFRSSNLDEAGLKTKWQAIDKSTEAASTVNGLAGLFLSIPPARRCIVSLRPGSRYG